MLAFYLYMKVAHSDCRKVPAIGDLVRLKISCDQHKYTVLGYVKNVTTINPDSNCIQGKYVLSTVLNKIKHILYFLESP